MKLSVVIPVYRVESTLDRCVESVLRQDVTDLEVILVDDGSPDNCPKMCDKWAKEDPRICVIHKENGGLSDARNAGLDIAKGDVVTFVDSDDFLAANTYWPLLNLMGDADLLEFPIAGRLTLSDHTYNDVNDYWLKEQVYLHTYAWNKLYRHELFSDVRYPKGRVFEDAYTLPLLLKRCRKVKTAACGTYHYCDNSLGISATADGRQLTMLLEAHLNNEMPVDDIYYLHLANIQMDVWERTRQPILLPQRRLNTSLFHSKKKLKAIALNILGINGLCRINKLLHHLRKPTRW